MTFKRFNRRLHAYLGVLLLPWLGMYAISAFFFNHGQDVGASFKPDGPAWTARFDRPYDRAIPEDADVREIAKLIIADAGLEGSFWAHMPNPNRLNVHVFDFFNTTRLTYRVAQQRLTGEDKVFRWDHFFTGLHVRGGFGQDSVLSDAWAVLVDLACVGIVVWVISGIVMWAQQSTRRVWGGVAMAGGVVTFVVFMMVL